jgi:hypothetical protein
MATKKLTTKPAKKKEVDLSWTGAAKLPAKPNDAFTKAMIDFSRAVDSDEDYLKGWVEKYVWLTTICARLKLEPKPMIAFIKKLIPNRFRKDELPLIYPEDVDYALITFLPTSTDVNTNEVLKTWAGMRKFLVKNDIHIAVLD